MTLEGLFHLNPGGDLLSHTAARAVPSALRGLTSVFEMGTGVTPSALPPRNRLWLRFMRFHDFFLSIAFRGFGLGFVYVVRFISGLGEGEPSPGPY